MGEPLGLLDLARTAISGGGRPARLMDRIAFIRGCGDIGRPVYAVRSARVPHIAAVSP